MYKEFIWRHIGPGTMWRVYSREKKSRLKNGRLSFLIAADLVVPPCAIAKVTKAAFFARLK